MLLTPFPHVNMHLIRCPRSARTDSSRNITIDELGAPESWYVEGFVHIGLLVYF